ncbi:MAG TPA: hypothetical protein PL048_03040 [Leptospiraceae bacterium]|nr:hypothetical protein [Leptospiraceae bacterium]HMY67436.1 hypothetical protein [Leptospiraceae bacterium]HMZ57723.1 hypothetical protein [Leptospiraceae bacterium]HNF15006.1 hypothetical protein [Leptospiraceae bacterium]HNF26259.1 hypothetical protein [Leptospiraceae bacterium]
MRKSILIFTAVILLTSSNCRSREVKEIESDDILEEELRAEPEPFRETRKRDLKNPSKKQ